MKNSSTALNLLFSALSGLASFTTAQPQNSLAGMRDVAKHDELSRKLRMANQSDPIRDLGPPAGKSDEDPSLPMAERDLVKSSAVFSYRGYLTLVPKRAVLHVPPALEGRLAIVNGAKVQTWKNFHQSNRGWIRTMEVSREQALGHVAFSEEAAKAISDSSVVVVATYKGGPISVLPLKEEDQVPSRDDMKPITFQKQ